MLDEIQEQIDKLNSGILNPKNAPSHLTSSQCISLSMLSMKLDAEVKSFNSSRKDVYSVFGMKDTIKKIEQEAKDIISS
jgi:hypothetical protein